MCSARRRSEGGDLDVLGRALDHGHAAAPRPRPGRRRRWRPAGRRRAERTRPARPRGGRSAASAPARPGGARASRRRGHARPTSLTVSVLGTRQDARPSSVGSASSRRTTRSTSAQVTKRSGAVVDADVDRDGVGRSSARSPLRTEKRPLGPAAHDGHDLLEPLGHDLGRAEVDVLRVDHHDERRRRPGRRRARRWCAAPWGRPAAGAYCFGPSAPSRTP